ncbi:MAG: RluA family pseudouridine synthase [Ruminococcaceae bacterium]|nr:RluA family pseudouridine synthase [Oscillospiraceae bacterium]
MRTLKYTADKSFEGKKASSLLTHIGCSREIIKMLKNGGLLINGSPAFTVQLLKENDVVELVFPDEVSSAVPKEIDGVEIVYSDEDIAVVNKPPDLPIHQSVGHYDDTLANHFAAVFPNCAFRAVTRLDRNTSGLCVVALNKLSAAIMCQNRPQKLYYAICQGLTPPAGSINAPIARECESMIKRVVRSDGQEAVTDYKTLKSFDNKSLLEISLRTGRTHQIRVHLAYIGHPLLGDDLYGGDRGEIGRHALHCGYIKLAHPITKKVMEFERGVPEDMERCLNK